MATSTKIKPEDLKDMNFSTYNRLFNKDLARLSKKTGFQDFIFIQNYKFGSKKEHLILFVDPKDKDWTEAIALAKKNISGQIKEASGSCRVIEEEDRDGDGDSDITFAIKTVRGSLTKKKVVDLINEVYEDNEDVEAVLLKELTDDSDEKDLAPKIDESKLDDKQILEKRTKEKTGITDKKAEKLYTHSSEDKRLLAFVDAHNAVFEKGKLSPSDVIGDLKAGMTKLRKLDLEEDASSFSEAILLNEKINKTLIELENIIHHGEIWLGAKDKIEEDFKSQFEEVKEQVKIVKKMMVVIAKMDAAVENKFNVEDQITVLLNVGATIEQIVFLIQKESNPKVLHKQIDTAKDKNVTQICNLYKVATSTQITALLEKEKNAERLLEQIEAEANQSPILILDLYTKEVNADLITKLLAKEKDAELLLNQIEMEANNNAEFILELYNADLNADQINDLLSKEKDAELLHKQIALELNQRPELILKLYNANLSSRQINRMLEHVNDAKLLIRLMKPNPKGLSFTDIKMASVEKGLVGSIYFDGGRIRLVHGHGPEIDFNYNPIERYTLGEKDYKAFNLKNDNNGFGKGENRRNKRYNYFIKLKSCKRAEIGDTGKLIEFLGPERILHPSRGLPKAFDYIKNQRQFDILYNAATTKNNAAFLKYINIDEDLAKIPMQAP